MLVTLSYHSKVNLDGPLDAEKFAEAGCLYVFDIGFQASLFPPDSLVYLAPNWTSKTRGAASLEKLLRRHWYFGKLILNQEHINVSKSICKLLKLYKKTYVTDPV